MSRILTEREVNDLKAYANDIGFPEESFEEYLKAVETEIDIGTRGIKTGVIAENYPSSLLSPNDNYQDKILEQNRRIATLRRALGTTTAGRQTIEKIPDSYPCDTIPVPRDIIDKAVGHRRSSK